MTDEETHKTGELLLSLAGRHSIVVIEHDMVFVRQIARKVTVLTVEGGSVVGPSGEQVRRHLQFNCLQRFIGMGRRQSEENRFNAAEQAATFFQSADGAVKAGGRSRNRGDSICGP